MKTNGRRYNVWKKKQKGHTKKDTKKRGRLTCPLGQGVGDKRRGRKESAEDTAFDKVCQEKNQTKGKDSIKGSPRRWGGETRGFHRKKGTMKENPDRHSGQKIAEKGEPAAERRGGGGG